MGSPEGTAPTATQRETKEIRRIELAYAERDRTLSGSLKRDQRNRGNQWIRDDLRGRLEQMLRERFGSGLADFRVLDIGCGYGSLLTWFRTLGLSSENLFGIDLLANRVEAARRAHPEFTFVHGNAEHLDFPNDSFDLVTAFTVFSSIVDPVMAQKVAERMAQLVRSDGAVVWYDMRYPNPWNRHTIPMTKSRIGELFPTFAVDVESITLLPPLARRLGRTCDWTYPLLASVPPLRGHYLGLLCPGSAP